jgi:hypothetical protein
MAFTQNITPTFVRQPTNAKFQITSTMSSTGQALYTGGVSGSKITALNAISSSTTASDVQIGITNSGVNYPLGTVAVPGLSGNSSTSPSVNLLDPTKILGLAVDSDGNPYIQLGSTSDILTVAALTPPAAGKLITVIAPSAGDF